MTTGKPMRRFDFAEVERAADEWGANCGPVALAAMLDVALDDLRPHLGDFEQRGYMSAKAMSAALNSLGLWRALRYGPQDFPAYGLALVQFLGPWTAPGAHWAEKLRRTHWVGHVGKRWARPPKIFDVNCGARDGWASAEFWAAHIVPYILREAVPGANGGWRLHAAIEISVDPQIDLSQPAQPEARA